jgi:hypothetical protein
MLTLKQPVCKYTQVKVIFGFFSFGLRTDHLYERRDAARHVSAKPLPYIRTGLASSAKLKPLSLANKQRRRKTAKGGNPEKPEQSREQV